jgi:hypothetical protein
MGHPHFPADHVALASAALIQRVLLSPRDRLFNKGKIVVKDFLSSRTSSHGCCRFTAAMTISAAIKARAILALY